MNRIKDYAGFVGWFAGLGYIVLWPITAADLGGKPFGASIFCTEGASRLTDLLCNSAQPLHMPAGLHVLGFLSAAFVTIRLLLYAIRHTRRAAGGPISPAVRIPAALAQAPRQKPVSRRPPIKPRAHFCLRGMPERAPVLEKDDA
jgi:hypothetical protein